MNFPKITLKSKFPSQMLSQSPKDGPPEDSPPFLEASHRDGFLYFHQLYFSYFRFVDWHFLSPIAWNWSMQPFTATLSHFFSKYKDKYKYKDNDNDKYIKSTPWKNNLWDLWPLKHLLRVMPSLIWPVETIISWVAGAPRSGGGGRVGVFNLVWTYLRCLRFL